jgi:hypothetical protein
MKLPFLLVCTLLGGCLAGGGGLTHLPPDHFSSGQPTELKLAFSVWGAGSGRLDRRYTDVICLYQVNDSGALQRLNGTVVSADEKRMAMKFILPALDLKKGDEVIYHFEMLFDGQKNTRAGGRLKVQ